MEKRIVKIKFLDYWSHFYESEMNDCLIIRILKKYYNVRVCDDADYVFYSTAGESHWGVSDHCVKIFQTGENVVPDFNACDYGIGFEWMDYEDRYIRFPNYMFYEAEMLHKMEHKHEIPTDFDLHKMKPDFCSFVVSNHRNPKRKDAFDALGTIKKVDSGGRFLNNIGGPVKDKFAFDSTHRFSLCFENGAHNGYTTEKLVQAFAARTVPIYWGDPEVGRVFNKKAMVDAYSFNNEEMLIEEVKRIYNDDSLYMQMLREPALLPTTPLMDEELRSFENWLIHIFEQPLEKAYRRNREMHGRWYIERRLKLDSRSNRDAINEIRKQKVCKMLKIIKKNITWGGVIDMHDFVYLQILQYKIAG